MWTLAKFSRNGIYTMKQSRSTEVLQKQCKSEKRQANENTKKKKKRKQEYNNSMKNWNWKLTRKTHHAIGNNNKKPQTLQLVANGKRCCTQWAGISNNHQQCICVYHSFIRFTSSELSHIPLLHITHIYSYIYGTGNW